MGGNAGGGGNGGRSGGGSTNGDAGQPGEVVREANKANAGLIPADKLGKAVLMKDKLETKLQEHSANQSGWDANPAKVLTPGQYQQTRAKIDKLGKAIKPSMDRLTKEARGEVMAEINYPKQTRGRILGNTKELKNLKAKGKLYK
jgi:hypothetical protein